MVKLKNGRKGIKMADYIPSKDGELKAELTTIPPTTLLR